MGFYEPRLTYMQQPPVIAGASVYLGRKIDKDITLSTPAVYFMYICAVIVTIIGVVTLDDLIA